MSAEVEDHVVVAFVVVLTAEGAGCGFVFAAAVAADVYGGVDGAAHGLLGGLAAACDVEAGAVVGGCAHIGETCGEVDAGIHGERLERSETLVVVHGKHTIEPMVKSAAEEAVGGIWAESEYPGGTGFLDGGSYDVGFLAAEKAFLAGMRIEREDGDAGGVHAEVADERAVEYAQFLQNGLFGYGLRHPADGKVCGDKGYTDIIGAEHHKRLVVGIAFRSERRFEILGVARKTELFALYGMLVDGCGDEHVYEAAAEVGDGALKGGEGCLACGPALHSWLYFDVLAYDVDDVDGAVADFFAPGVLRHLHGGHIEGLAIESGNLGRAVDHRCAKFEQARVLKGLEYDFVAYAVDVAVGDAHSYESLVHCVGCWLVYFAAGFLSREHAAGCVDVLAAGRPDGGCDSALVEAVAESLHCFLRGRLEGASGYGMVAYEIGAGGGAFQETRECVGVVHVVVDAPPHGVLHGQPALVGEVVLPQLLDHLRDRPCVLHRHDVGALGVEGRVDAESHMDLAFIEQTVERRKMSDGADGDTFGTPGEAPGRGEHFEGLKNGVDVVERFTHAHEYYIRKVVALGYGQYLVHNLRSRELAVEALAARHAETAAHAASGLGADAECGPVAVGDIDGFDVASGGTAEKIFHGSVGAAGLGEGFFPPGAPSCGKSLASALAEVGHGVDVGFALAIEPAGYLACGKGRKTAAGGDFAQPHEVHAEQRLSLLWIHTTKVRKIFEREAMDFHLL